jgi:hypothetical protein
VSEIDDADLNIALTRAFPTGFAILRFEGGTGIICRGGGRRSEQAP